LLLGFPFTRKSQKREPADVPERVKNLLTSPLLPTDKTVSTSTTEAVSEQLACSTRTVPIDQCETRVFSADGSSRSALPLQRPTQFWSISAHFPRTQPSWRDFASSKALSFTLS
jgi:hypothetical protein